MCSCVVETSSVLPRKSRLFSLMLGNVWKRLCRLRTTIGGSLEIFKKDLGNLWKTIHRSRHYFVYIINKLINSCLLYGIYLLMFKEFLVVYPFPMTFNSLWPSIFVNIVVLLFTRTIKVIYYSYLFHIVFH